MSQAASSEKDHGVGIVKKNDDGPQEPPAGGEGEPQDAQVGEAPPPASTEPSKGDAAAEPSGKKEDFDAVASEKDAPSLQGRQPTVAGKPEPQVVGEGGEAAARKIMFPAEAPVVNVPETKKRDATDRDPASTSSSKDKKPRLSLRTEVAGLLQSVPSSASMEDGKLVAESPTRRSKVTEINFPMKLYDMLSNPDNQHAISWMPHGRSWKVRQKDVFMRTICPQYFSQSKFESFIRQANGWGFRRIRKEGPDRNSYYHELFLRGKPELMRAMSRPLPGQKASQEVGDPNFYNMPAMPLMPHEEMSQTLSKQVSFASPSVYGGKKKSKKKESKTVRSSAGSAFSDPYGESGPYDSRWHGMPPPPSSPWGAPYAYPPHPPDYGGYGLPPPPPESAVAGWPHQLSPSRQGPGTNMPSPPNDIPPFDPAFYFPPPYYPPFPPPPPPSQIPQVSSQDQADQGANVETKMDRPLDAQVPPPYFRYQYPPYPPSYPHPPGDMPYLPPPPAEGGPTSIHPDSSASYHYHYQFGSVPPNPLPPNHLPNFDSDPNLDRKDSFQFSPIQHPDG